MVHAGINEDMARENAMNAAPGSADYVTSLTRTPRRSGRLLLFFQNERESRLKTVLGIQVMSEISVAPSFLISWKVPLISLGESWVIQQHHQGHGTLAECTEHIDERMGRRSILQKAAINAALGAWV